jgi:hypothetical protein
MATQTAVPEVAVARAVPQTSEIPSEVELAPEAEVNVLIAFATHFKSFNQSLSPVVRRAAEDLKKAFSVRQGYQGKTLVVEGHEMEWKTFVDKYFGITPRRFNQILEIPDETKAPKGGNGGKGGDGGKGDKGGTLDVVAPAGDGNKFEELDSKLHAALEELQRMKADPVALVVERWSELEPDRVQAELTRIIEALNLGGYLRVEIDEVQ